MTLEAAREPGELVTPAERYQCELALRSHLLFGIVRKVRRPGRVPRGSIESQI